MIHSMTAYARLEHKADWGNAILELRSVNQRYLESFIRLPEQLRSLEPLAREKFRKRLNRGKLEFNLRYNPNPAAQAKQNINKALAEDLLANANWVQVQDGVGDINPLDVLRWPGVMEAEETDMDAIQAEILSVFDQLLDDFVAMRGREGDTLKALIEQRLDNITQQVALVREQMPAVMQWQRERLLTRLEECKAELDQNRMEQEMIYLAQKVDVAEELDRLDSHVKETRNILKKGGACGRRLDFMMQEFNREANTLASKSINAEITNAAVELKVLIEQMREQIQNIE